MLYNAFAQWLRCTVYNKIYTTKVIGRFNYIVHIYCLTGCPDCFCFEYITGLFFRESASLHVIGVICKIYLGAMIYSSFSPDFFLLAQGLQQRRYLLTGIQTLWQRGFSRYAPCFSHHLSTRYFTLHTIVAGCTLGYSMNSRIFFNRNEIHTV